MPVALVPILTGIGLSAGIAGTVANIVTAGVLIGLNLLLGQKKPESHQSQQVMGRAANPARRIVYGRAKLGGEMYLQESNGSLYQGLVHCEGPVDAIEEWWLNDLKIDGGVATADTALTQAGVWPWQQYASYQSQIGAADQAANSLLVGAFGAWWGNDRRNRGLCLTALKFDIPPDPDKNFQKQFPTGIPALRVVVRGRKLFDPRTNITAWSENPALVIRDYLTSSRGFDIDEAWINDASFADFANLCAQGVYVGPGYPAELRYRCDGSFTLDQEPRDVLRKMLATCDGELVSLPDGTIGIRGGRWDNPTVILTQEMMIEVEVRRGNGAMASYNQIKPRYTDPTQDYQQIEGATYDDMDAQALRGSVVPSDLDVEFVPSYTQALRLAKIRMAKDNPKHALTMTCGVAAFGAWSERIVHVSLPMFGIDEGFWVKAQEIDLDAMTIRLELGSLSPDAYAWAGATVTGPTPPPGPPPGYVIPSVSGLALSIATSTLGGKQVQQVKLIVTPPSDKGLLLAAQYRRVGDASWLDMVSDNAAYTALSGYLTDGASYEVRAAFKAFGSGRLGTYATGTIVAKVDTVAPSPPTSLAKSLASGTVTLTWTNPGSANFYAARIYRATGASAVFADALLVHTRYGAPSSSGTWDDTPAAGATYRYWATAINQSGVESASAGPVTQAV